MATVGDLKKAVSGFTNRTEFVVGGFDVLLRACNNARLYAERTVDFEYNRVSITVPSVDVTTGASLLTAVLYGTATSVRVKRLIRGFLALSDASGTFPVEVISRDKWLKKIQRKAEMAMSTNPNQFPLESDNVGFAIAQTGQTIYVLPASATPYGSSTINVYFECYRWMTDYTDDDTGTDFLLDTCFDYLMYKAIQELNFFLKDDERVNISAKVMDDAFQSMKAWNASIIGLSVDDGDLV